VPQRDAGPQRSRQRVAPRGQRARLDTCVRAPSDGARPPTGCADRLITDADHLAGNGPFASAAPIATIVPIARTTTVIAEPAGV
jgi:hypothetical protein